jgi:hypothetical protein
MPGGRPGSKAFPAVGCVVCAREAVAIENAKQIKRTAPRSFAGIFIDDLVNYRSFASRSL